MCCTNSNLGEVGFKDKQFIFLSLLFSHQSNVNCNAMSPPCCGRVDGAGSLPIGPQRLHL